MNEWNGSLPQNPRARHMPVPGDMVGRGSASERKGLRTQACGTGHLRQGPALNPRRSPWPDEENAFAHTRTRSREFRPRRSRCGDPKVVSHGKPNPRQNSYASFIIAMPSPVTKAVASLRTKQPQTSHSPNPKICLATTAHHTEPLIMHRGELLAHFGGLQALHGCSPC